MNKTLTLVKMGCDFWEDDIINTLSDCENYRIETRKELVKGKDGNNYFLSFGTYSRRITRKTNKRTGKQLKNPVEEIVNSNALRIDTSFDNEEGSWCNWKLEEQLNKFNLSFTKEDILTAVNYISCDNYTSVEIVER